MTNQLKRSLAMVLTMALLMGVMILGGAASASTDAAALGVQAAAAVPQADAQDTALYDTGDVDNNKEVDASDALIALQYSVQLRDLNRAENRAADVNGDGLIDASDALLILQKSVNLISTFAVDNTEVGVPDNFSLNEKLQEYTGNEYYFGNFKTAKKVYVIGAAGSNMTIPERFCALALQGIVARKGESQIAVVYDFDSYNQWLKELQEVYGIQLEYVNNLWDLVDQFKSYITDSHYTTYTFFDENNPALGTVGDLTSYANACTIAGQEGWLPIDSKLESKAKEHGLTAGTKTASSVLGGDNASLGNAANFEEYDLAEHYGFVGKMNINNGDGTLNADMMILLGARDYNMRDVGIAKGCLFVTNNQERNWDPFLKQLNPNAVILGWVDSEGTSELINLDNPIVSHITQMGIALVPTDHANNISVFAGLEKSNFKQTPSLNNARTNTNQVHYVTLIMEGGTSYSFVERGFVQTQAHLPFVYWNNKSRGTIPMGWTLTPMMTDMSPLILNYLYKTASVNDQFVAGLSGLGYNYSNILGTEDPASADALRKEHYKRTGEYMQGANMDYITIMETAPIEDNEARASQLSYYSEPAGIKGGFLYYLNGTGYVTGNAGLPGAIYWSNNKPFVNLRDCLAYSVNTSLDSFKANGSRVAIKSQSERNEMLQQLAWKLNNRTKDATVIDGYSAINVYQWAFSYEDCVTLSKMLDEDVVLVSPGEFLKLIQSKVAKQNATVSKEPQMGENDKLPALPGQGLAEKDAALALTATQETVFDFSADQGTQGWNLVAGEGDRDNAFFSENSRTKALQINLAGTKVDDEDINTPNAMTYNKIAVPSSAKVLSLHTGSASSADIRLLAVDEQGNETVIQGTKSVKDENGETVKQPTDWVRIASGSNVTNDWDISAVSGKNTVFYIQLRGASVRITGIELQ